MRDRHQLVEAGACCVQVAAVEREGNPVAQMGYIAALGYWLGFRHRSSRIITISFGLPNVLKSGTKLRRQALFDFGRYQSGGIHCTDVNTILVPKRIQL